MACLSIASGTPSEAGLEQQPLTMACCGPARRCRGSRTWSLTGQPVFRGRTRINTRKEPVPEFCTYRRGPYTCRRSQRYGCSHQRTVYGIRSLWQCTTKRVQYSRSLGTRNMELSKGGKGARVVLESCHVDIAMWITRSRVQVYRSWFLPHRSSLVGATLEQRSLITRYRESSQNRFRDRCLVLVTCAVRCCERFAENRSMRRST